MSDHSIIFSDNGAVKLAQCHQCGKYIICQSGTMDELLVHIRTKHSEICTEKDDSTDGTEEAATTAPVDKDSKSGSGKRVIAKVTISRTASKLSINSTINPSPHQKSSDGDAKVNDIFHLAERCDNVSESSEESPLPPNDRYLDTLTKWRPYRCIPVYCPRCDIAEIPVTQTYTVYLSHNQCISECIKRCKACRFFLPNVPEVRIDLHCRNCNQFLGILRRDAKKFIPNKRFMPCA